MLPNPDPVTAKDGQKKKELRNEKRERKGFKKEKQKRKG